ncbi:uncharacterized [Tachysurus ichikawai]
MYRHVAGSRERRKVEAEAHRTETGTVETRATPTGTVATRATPPQPSALHHDCIEQLHDAHCCRAASNC